MSTHACIAPLDLHISLPPRRYICSRASGALELHTSTPPRPHVCSRLETSKPVHRDAYSPPLELHAPGRRTYSPPPSLHVSTSPRRYTYIKPPDLRTSMPLRRYAARLHSARDLTFMLPRLHLQRSSSAPVASPIKFLQTSIPPDLHSSTSAHPQRISRVPELQTSPSTPPQRASEAPELQSSHTSIPPHLPACNASSGLQISTALLL